MTKTQGIPSANFAVRPVAADYSDGEAIELSLLEHLRSCADVGASATGLLTARSDWPSTYHLSPARHNLLRFLGLGPAHRILELGCGCGAITRYLGETGAEVVAVEASERRAQIARERCRDLPNVNIRVGDLMALEEDRCFDIVTLIGVLEYAPKYIDAPDPVVACLAKAATFLSPGGRLLVAIENKLGLKYFNGLPEDHLGTPYSGILDLYGIGTPITFGRAELKATLRQAGLPAQAFFYPFPDYKLPKLVLTEAALKETDLSVANLLALMASRDPTGTVPPAFHEPLAWRGVVANGLLPDLANSFLVVAGRDQATLPALDVNLLAIVFSPERQPRYATETIFRKSSDDRITVEKIPLYPDTDPNTPPPSFASGELLHRTGTVEDHVPGELYIVELQRRMARGEGLHAMIDWARDWLELVKAACMKNSALLPGHWMDAIPQNFIRTANGKLVNIDTEWSVSQPVPAAWIIFRGLIYALSACPTSKALQGLSLLDTIRRTSAAAGFEIDDAAVQQACGLEADLRTIVYGEAQATTLERLHRHLSEPPQSGIGGPTYREITERQSEALENEIRRVKSTVSWQVTKPLRALWSIPQRLVTRLLGQQRKERR